MFAPSQSPTASYRTIGVETGVMAASPHKLILMLFDGALLAIALARQAIESQDVATKGKEISRAIDILANGLKASLDFAQGGELAERLAALYDYMADRLLFANLHSDAAALAEVQGLLVEIKQAWEEIADDPTVVSDGTKPE